MRDRERKREGREGEIEDGQFLERMYSNSGMLQTCKKINRK